MTRLSPVIRKVLDTGITLGEMSARNLGGSREQRVCRVAKEAIQAGFKTPEQILAYASTLLPDAAAIEIDSALNHLCVKRQIVRDGEGYVMR